MNKLFLAGLSLFFFSSCSSDVDFGEQYRKIVYIVKSDDGAYLREHKISAQEQEGGISLYCGGSDVLKEDVKVTLVPDEEAMQIYNAKTFDEKNEYKKLIVLPEQYYTISSYSVTIKAGTEYAKLPIILKTEGLDPDSCYAIPLSISDASDYEVNEELNTVFYQVDLINDYSGDFIGVSQNIKGDDTTFIAKDKPLKAIKEKQIRTSIYNFGDVVDDIKNLETNYMLLTIEDDNKVTITPWKDAEITDLGNGVYIPEERKFRLHYKCEDAEGNVLEIIEELVDIEAVLDDENE